MRARRSRRLDLAPDRAWAVVSDPWSLPRWWPRTARVEDVGPDGWTSVMATDRGRAVRLDFRWVDRAAPVRVRWAQEIAGSPFERLLRSHEVEVSLAPADGGTAVTIAIEQDLRGWARLAPFLVRRAAGRQAGEALDGLAGLA